MSSKKLTVGGEYADVQYNLRTTKSIMDSLVEKSGQSESVNRLINKILYSWKNKYEKSKRKK